MEVDRKYNPEGIIPYDNPATVVNDEARFLTEGCREPYNKIYFQADASSPIGNGDGEMVDPVFYTTSTDFELNWRYVAYEDFIEKVARERCEWRDYLQMCYCITPGSNPPVPIDSLGDYVFYEDLYNPEVVVNE